MTIGTVKEIKSHEYRVAITPSGARSYVAHGHTLLVEKNAGRDAGFEDHEYEAAGAILVEEKQKIFDECEMIVKVKEPLPEEFDLFHEDQILFTYLHLSASWEVTDALMKKRVKAVAYETIETEDGQLPCLKPMSEIAGRLSIQEGAKYLEKTFGGRGVLLGGVPGVHRGKVAILGGGVVGANATKVAVGMGADVTVLDVNADRLGYLDDIYSTHISTLYSTTANLEEALAQSDLVIGAVLLPGARAPQLIKRSHLGSMKPGVVIVDVAVDQGGTAETTRPTTHDDPVYIVDDVVHYCVTNMPSAVPLSSTLALCSTTAPYGLLIAEYGLEEACRKSLPLHRGVNLYRGKCVYANVAKNFNIEPVALESLL
jgi:alanine dehydrogenase